MNMKKSIKTLTLLMAAMIMLGCIGAFADTGSIPAFSEHLTDAAPEDYCGYWSLRWIRSDEPVDMQSFGNLEIYPNGSVNVSRGNYEDAFYYLTEMEDAGNGCLYFPDESGTDGTYCFLFDDGILGCADTLENPGTIYYYEFYSEMEYDQPEQLRISEQIWGYIGEQVYEAGAEEYAGTWRAYDCTNDNGDLYGLYMLGAEVDIVIEGEKATIISRISGDEESYESNVIFESGNAVIKDEYEEDDQYLVLCADGRLALLDDPEFPESVMFFLPEDRWEEAMADVHFNGNPRPVEQIAIESLEAVAGDWTATHINYGGALYSLMVIGTDEGISISESDGIFIRNEDEFFSAESRIENGYLVVTNDVEEEFYFFLYDGHLLVMSEYPDDLSMATYYQRDDLIK